jgi:glutamate-1-semialdehyde aminotransferase
LATNEPGSADALRLILEYEVPAVQLPVRFAGATALSDTPPPRIVKPYDTATGNAAVVPALVEHYVRTHQASRAYMATHRQYLADNRNIANFSLPFKDTIHPIIAKQARGAHVVDADGNALIDVGGGFGPILFGHNPPFVREAVCKVLDADGWALGFEHTIVGETSKKFCQVTGMDRVTWVNTGTEGTTLAMRLCRLRTGRPKIVMFNGSYHGHFDGFLGVAMSPDMPDKCVPVAGGISRGFVENLVMLEYNSVSSLEWIERHSDEIAGVFCEAVQNRSPDIVPQAFLQKLRALTAARGVVLVFDEVVTGFRIGSGGVQEHLGIQADLVCYGKALGGGWPARARRACGGHDWC